MIKYAVVDTKGESYVKFILAYFHSFFIVGSEELEAVVGARGVSAVLTHVKHCYRHRDAGTQRC